MTVHLWAIGGVYRYKNEPYRLVSIKGEMVGLKSADEGEEWAPEETDVFVSRRSFNVTGPTHLPCPVCGELQQVADYGLSGHLELCWLRNEMKKEDLQTDFSIAESRAPNAHDYEKDWAADFHTFHSCGNQFRLIHRWHRTDSRVPATWLVCIKSNSQGSTVWRTLVGPFEDVNELLNVSWYATEYRQALQIAVDAINPRDIPKESENKSRNAENAGKTRQNCVFFNWGDVQYAIIQMPDLQFGLCVESSTGGFRMLRKRASLENLLMPGQHMDIYLECVGKISREFGAAAMAAWQAENGNVEE